MQSLRDGKLVHLVCVTRGDRTDDHSGQVGACIAKNRVAFPSMEQSGRQKAVHVIGKIGFKLGTAHRRLGHSHREHSYLKVRHRDLWYVDSSAKLYGLIYLV